MDFAMQNKPNQKMKCRTKILSPWMNLPLGLLFFSPFTSFVVAAQGETVAPSQAIATNQNYWAVEDAAARAKLPLYKTIPAAYPEELTPANGYPKRKTFLTWERSHGDNSGARYSALDQINRQNVTNLQVAWIYHSKDGSNAIQCNPIIVRDVMIVPTPGKFVVGVNAENGRELWRFKPEGRPAFRGLIYWPGGIFCQ